MYRQNSTNVHSGTERPSQDKFDRFEAWLKENGAQFDLVSRVVIDRTCRFFACFLSRRWGVRHLHERFCVEEMSCKIVKHRTSGLARAKVQHMEYIASCNNHWPLFFFSFVFVMTSLIIIVVGIERIRFPQSRGRWRRKERTTWRSNTRGFWNARSTC